MVSDWRRPIGRASRSLASRWASCTGTAAVPGTAVERRRPDDRSKSVFDLVLGAGHGGPVSCRVGTVLGFRSSALVTVARSVTPLHTRVPQPARWSQASLLAPLSCTCVARSRALCAAIVTLRSPAHRLTQPSCPSDTITHPPADHSPSSKCSRHTNVHTDPC